MAKTAYQLNLEKWIRNVWLVSNYGQEFQKVNLKLKSGGEVEFDAVSKDKTIVGMISTSGWKTSSGKNGQGKYNKIRSDILSLTQTQGNGKRLILLTEKDMYDKCVHEQDNGRNPAEIEFCLVKIPANLKRKLNKARQLSIDEIVVKNK